MIHKKVKKNTDFLGLFVLTTVSEAGFFLSFLSVKEALQCYKLVLIFWLMLCKT